MGSPCEWRALWHWDEPLETKGDLMNVAFWFEDAASAEYYQRQHSIKWSGDKNEPPQ